MSTQSEEMPIIPERPIIYIVTSGHYSDYSIQAAFDNEAMADEFIQRFGQSMDDPQIEEHQLNLAVPEARAGLTAFSVYMHRDGELVQAPSEGGWIDGTQCEVIASSTTARWAERFHAGSVFYCSCWARDAQHAVKIANEKRVQMIALGQWLEDQP